MYLSYIYLYRYICKDSYLNDAENEKKNLYRLWDEKHKKKDFVS